jgi:5'-nucleotidase
MAARPLALLSNDDGYTSRGLLALRTALLADWDVIVVAPEHEQSASSHALSLRAPLRLRPVSEGVFALSGTPADCVYVALHGGHKVLPRAPDLVLSGVNLGPNLGQQDSFYSGTVAAAREAALRGLPALAVSAHLSLDLARVAGAAVEVARALLESFRRAPRAVLLSVNFPPAWNDQVRATRLGHRVYDERVDFRTDPNGRGYLWLGGPGVRHDGREGTDTSAYDAHAASVTPLVLDLTAGAELDEVSRIVGDLQIVQKDEEKSP